MTTIRTVFDDFIQFENLNDVSGINIKRDKFLDVFSGQLTVDKLIYFVHNELSSKTYSKERFLELCIENNILDRELLTALFLHVHSKAHLYSYFRDYGFSEKKILSFFESIGKPFLCFEARNQFDKLPNEFEIYRGLYSEPTTIDQMGYCWTLNESIAIKFALSNPNFENGYILTGTARKEDICGYILCLDEEEIVISSKFVSSKKVREVSKEKDKNACC
jgi:hypothetical protein